MRVITGDDSGRRARIQVPLRVYSECDENGGWKRHQAALFDLLFEERARLGRPHVYATDAIVLRRADFGEDSRLVTLLARSDGKKTAIARGARRPGSHLGCHLEPFTLCRLFVAQGRNMDLISQARTVDAYSAVRADLDATAAACYAVEVVDRATMHDQEQHGLFDLLAAFLARLDQGGKPEPLLRFLDMRVLTLMGYRPALWRCASCTAEVSDDGPRYSETHGGLHCRDCAAGLDDARPVSWEAIAILRLWQSGAYQMWEAQPPGAAPTAEASAILRASIFGLLDREPRSVRLLERLREQREPMSDGRGGAIVSL